MFLRLRKEASVFLGRRQEALMKEYVVYDNVISEQTRVDLLVISTDSIIDAQRKFIQAVEEYDYLDASGIHACIKKKGKVVAWYEYQKDTNKWQRVRKPKDWHRWQPMVEDEEIAPRDFRHRRHTVF